MLRTTAVAWAIAVLALGMPAIATAGAKRGASGAGTCAGAYVVAKDAASLAKASTAVLCLVNAERTSRGLPGIRASAKLAGVARGHSEDMVANRAVSHIGSAGSVQDRVTQSGYRWRAVAETLTWGASRRSMPLRLVASFMQSSMHRSILLDPIYRDLGVGLAAGMPAGSAAGTSATLTLVFARS